MHFTIEESKWRCGGNGEHKHPRHADEVTYMCDNNGNMCCLGHVACQLSSQPDIKSRLRGRSTPLMASMGGADGLAPILLLEDLSHSPLTQHAMEFNDKPEIDHETRKQLLTELFYEHGHTLEFV